MTFKQLQDMTLEGAFAESMRADAKVWINTRLGWLWNVEEWEFTQGSSPVTVTAGSMAVSSVPADFGIATDLFNSQGNPLTPIEEYRNFAARYIGLSNIQTQWPEAFTVLGTSILIGPKAATTDTAYLLTYEKTVTLLVADGDIPAIPPEAHLFLVHGAKAEGYKLTDATLSQSYENDFQNGLATLGRRYLRSMRGTATQARAYRPGAFFGRTAR